MADLFTEDDVKALGLGGGASDLFTQDDVAQLLDPEPSKSGEPDEAGASPWTRFQASLRANKQDQLSFLRSKLGDGNVLPKLNKDRGEIENFYVREKQGGQWKLFDPDTGAGEDVLRGILESVPAALLGGPAAAAVPLIARGISAARKGDVLGDIADAGGDAVESGAAGGLALAALGPSALPVLTGPVGDATASVARQALSAALPGEESVSPTERAVAVGANVAAGLAGEALGAAGGAAVKGARKLLSPSYRLASEIAEEGGKEALSSGAKKTVTEYTARSDEIEKAIGDGFSFSPAQRSGSRAALMAQRTGEQMPEVMDDLAKQQAERLSPFAKFLDKTVAFIASDPKRLGNLETGRSVATTVRRVVTDADKRLSETVAPLYKEAERLLGDQKLSTNPATSVIKEEIDSLPANGGDVAGKLRKTLEALSESVDDAGTSASYKKLRAEQSFWTGLRHNPGTVLDGIDGKNARRIAGRVSRAIDDALSIAAEEGAGPGIAKLREANALYRVGRQKNEELATDTVKNILRLDKKAKPEEIASKAWKMSPDQLGGVVRILEQGDEKTLAQFRANSLKNMFEAAGKGSGSKVLGGELGGHSISPQKLVTLLEKNGERIDALFANQPEVAKRLRVAAGAAKRLAGATSIAGSDTAPKMWMAMAMRRFGAGNGAIMQSIEAVANNVLASPERMARVMSSPDGVDALSKLVISIARPSTTRQVAPSVARDIAASTTKLLSLSARFNEEPDDDSDRPTEEVAPGRVAGVRRASR